MEPLEGIQLSMAFPGWEPHSFVYDKGSLHKVFRDILVATVLSRDSSSAIVGSLSKDCLEVP